MTCTKCGATIKASMSKCAKCGLPLTYQDKVSNEEKLPLKSLLLRALAVLAAVVVTLIIIQLIEEPLRIRRQNKRITEQYVKQTVEAVTLENGMRFLADYLNGDKYYRIRRPGQNLDRARVQFALVADMERRRQEMREILKEQYAGR